ncbi:prephenate dehydratase [bacterium]|nr:prephenate dehydratase [bacterium]
MELKKLRNKINRLDYEIVKLLNERMEVALRTRKFKNDVEDTNREKIIIDNVCRYSHGLIKQDFSKKLFLDIIEESKKIQSRNKPLIGFQGEHGAYSEVAARNYNTDYVPIPCVEFADVFEGIENGHFDLGIVPVENSLEGAVTEVNDLLIRNDLQIIGEFKLPIHHCLLTLPETNYREIKIIYSHPQALAQCRGFISRNKLEPRPFYDTAGAARMIVNNQPKAVGAIASHLCAELYNLEIVKEEIEDETTNFTRFLILSKKKNTVKGNKCSIVFSVCHEAGALYHLLKVFSDENINMSRIESRPMRNDSGNYAFLVDFKGSDRDDKIQKVLNNIEEQAVLYKFLGCYTEAEL